MSLAITLEDIPEELYQKLKYSAKRNGRSIGSEAVVRLDEALASVIRPSEAELMAKVDEVRNMLAGRYFDPADIDRMKREGRP